MLAVMSKDVSQNLSDSGISLELDSLVIGDDEYDEDYDYEEDGGDDQGEEEDGGPDEEEGEEEDEEEEDA
jgi:hypothetical protein